MHKLFRASTGKLNYYTKFNGVNTYTITIQISRDTDKTIPDKIKANSRAHTKTCEEEMATQINSNPKKF